MSSNDPWLNRFLDPVENRRCLTFQAGLKVPHLRFKSNSKLEPAIHIPVGWVGWGLVKCDFRFNSKPNWEFFRNFLFFFSDGYPKIYTHFNSRGWLDFPRLIFWFWDMSRSWSSHQNMAKMAEIVKFGGPLVLQAKLLSILCSSIC